MPTTAEALLILLVAVTVLVGSRLTQIGDALGQAFRDLVRSGRSDTQDAASSSNAAQVDGSEASQTQNESTEEVEEKKEE